VWIIPFATGTTVAALGKDQGGAQSRTTLVAYTQQVYAVSTLIREVVLSRRARKDLSSIPRHLVTKLLEWVDQVQTNGLEITRTRPGFHDEPLKGRRKGQRSIRLSRAYRAIYVVCGDGSLEFVSVEEVNKHDY
jgi:proteic killer suppression protein